MQCLETIKNFSYVYRREDSDDAIDIFEYKMIEAVHWNNSTIGMSILDDIKLHYSNNHEIETIIEDIFSIYAEDEDYEFKSEPVPTSQDKEEAKKFLKSEVSA